jgi:hypothetical protein
MAPRPVRQSDVVLYGGFPEILHEEKGHVADLPFQWVAGRISSVDHDDIMLEPGFETMQWLGTTRIAKYEVGAEDLCFVQLRTNQSRALN